MTRKTKVAKFPLSVKLGAIRDYYSDGSSITAVARKWNINRTTLSNWLKSCPVDAKELSLPMEVIDQYRMKHAELTNEEILQKRISDLEQALAYEKMRSRAFEKMIAIAEKEEGISILKKGGVKQ